MPRITKKSVKKIAKPVEAVLPEAPVVTKPKAPTKNVPHLIVEARAGTGKTTTLVEGLRRIKGVSDGKLVPSPQQAVVWDTMAQGADNYRFVCFVAFNKSIATELQNRVPAGVDAMTMHSLGFKAVRSSLGSIKVDDWRVKNIISEITGRDIRELFKTRPTFVNAVQDLVALVKMNLSNTDEESLDKLCAHYDVECNGDRADVFEIVPKIIERCKDVSKDRCIDFNDMIWLPVVLDLPLFRYDLLLVDEAQDLNRCQQYLAKKAGKRLILCGDPKQAIYGFAGADSESMPRMFKELSETEVGCQTLPLTVTRRCGKAIVAEAKLIVADFEAFESNGEGKISKASYKANAEVAQKIEAGYVEEITEERRAAALANLCYRHQVQDGDMVICRVNAPLVSQCFAFLKEGRKANIQGRDVAKGLINTINKMKATDLPDLLLKLSDWKHSEVAKENAKRNPSDTRIIAIQDKYDCLCMFCEDCTTVQNVLDRIDKVFTDEKQSAGVKLSSVHRSKGLEAKRVFILQPEGASMPHPMAKSAWQREQEMNLKYVAITRAIEELVWVF